MNKCMEVLERMAEKLLNFLPDVCFGRVSVMKDKYRIHYGQRDWDELVHKIRRRTAAAYILLTLLLIIVLVFTMTAFPDEDTVINKLRRPEYGNSDKTEDVIVRAKYGDEIVENRISIRVPAAMLTEDEKRSRMDAYIKKLPTIILGKNKNLSNVIYDLFLPEKDNGTNILAEWDSSEPELINAKGELDTLKAAEGGEVILTAHLSLDGYTDEISLSVTVPPNVSKDNRRALNNRIQNTVRNIEEGTNLNSEEIVLPDKLEEGIPVQWSRVNKSYYIEILSLFLFGYILILFKRYDRMEKEYKAGKDAIIRDFPDFIDKMVLLLNAGLVTDSALCKIARDYRRFKNVSKIKPLYEGLCEIEKRITETKVPLIQELREFARQSGVRELSRFAAIVEDNINKGSTLTEKLEGEGNLLWLAKKKRIEEKGRLAETKLTFPLMLLLLVLIIITVAPILLEI